MEPVTNQSGDIAAAINAGKDQLQLLPEMAGYRRAAAIPKTSTIVALERDKLEAPRFLTATPSFNEANAFIEYINQFKDSGTRIFYSQEGVFVSVIDYHQFQNPRPRHGDHIATLTMLRSPEWETWAGESEKAMSQQEFAEFIEDNSRDIIMPDATEIFAIATGLHATVGATFRQAVNQANGTVNLQWDEQIDGTVRGTGKAIPTEFRVGLRPFMGSSRYPIDCRLRYRVSGGRLALHYKALHLDPITEAALEAVVLAISDQTSIKPALGHSHQESFKLGV